MYILGGTIALHWSI